MGRGQRRVVLAVGAVAVVLAGAVGYAHRGDLGHLDPVADERVGHAAASLSEVATRPRGGLTAAQTRVLREVAAAHRSGSTVVVPLDVATGAEGFERAHPRELVGRVLPLEVHVYTESWDWAGAVPPTDPSLRQPAPGPVVGDLGPAYLGCRHEDGVPGCSLVTMLRGAGGHWRVVDSWFVRFMGVDHWPNSLPIALQVRVYPDLSAPAEQYLVVGAAVGEPGSVALRTVSGAVEVANADRATIGEGFWTFRALLPEPPESVTAYDREGRAGPTWGVHDAGP